MAEPTAEIFLNEQQQTVVENLSANFLLLAPAGTGKTNALSARIAHILASGMARPEQVLCLTFTNRACREMRERVESVVGSEAAQALTVRTVHSFGYHLLLEYGDITGNEAMGIADEEDSLEIIKELLPEDTPYETHRKARLLAEFMEMVKHQMYRARSMDVLACAEQTLAAEDARFRKLCTGQGFAFDADLYEYIRKNGPGLMRRYQRILRDQQLYDFHDLVLGMGMLLEDEATRALLRTRYRYIHIDEVQDISDVEYDILTRMCPDAVFLLSGDENQTIYGWRGSVPDEILPRFERDFAAQRVYLAQNYRATRGLVNLSERFSAQALENRQPPPLAYTDRDVAIAGHDTLEEQSRWIFETLRSLDTGGDFSRVAVLCRSNAHCGQLARDFARFRRQLGDTTVRFMLAEEFKLFRTREVKDILAFVRLVLNPQEDTALARVAEHYFEGIGRGTLRDIGQLREALGIRVSDYIEERTQRAGDYFAPLLDALERGEVVVFDVESTGVDVYRDEIIQVAAVRVDKHAAPLDRLMEYIRAEKPVGDSARVHHIADQFLQENGGEPRDVLQRLCAFLRGKVVVGHNVGYDMGILYASLRRHGLPAPEISAVYDTLDIARRYLPELENHKLETLARHFATPHRPSHDAMEDILATADLLAEMAARYLAPQSAQRAEAYRKYTQALQPLRLVLQSLREAAQENNTAEFCALVAREMGMRKKFEAEPARIQNIALFLRFLKEPVFAGKWWRENLSTVLEYAALSSSELDRLSKETRKLSIITVHQAKGCEFDYVFVPSLVENAFPHYPAVKNGDVTEEARLFYVAITRARLKLFLSWHRRDEKNGRPTRPSRFLYQL